MNEEIEELFLTLASVFSYLKANAASRCIVEGEELLNSKHIILMGTQSQTERFLELFALCLQTSAIKSNPHEIKGKLSIVNDNKVEVDQFTCTCKAGLSGTCKHIAAVLLKCTRSSITLLEKLSSTDMKCYWINKKKVIEEEYEAKPILETACFAPKVKTKIDLTHEQQQECLSLLTSVHKESSLSCHIRGRTTATPLSEAKEEILSADVIIIISHAASSEYLTMLNLKIDQFLLKPCCKATIKEVTTLKSFHKAIMSTQRSEVWQQERQLRITGSRCYSIYTYSKQDWKTKATNYFRPKSFTSKYTSHGLKYESEALEKYRAVNQYNVCETGLVICQQYPWLAYSPDGIVMTEGIPTKLVEIKCPFDGKENDAIEFIHTCSYLELNAETGVTLKKSHSYYGQVHLGMAILNLKSCDLVVYSSKSKSFINIVVPFDEDFATKLLYTITEKYFKYMLHVICERRGL